MPGTSDGDRFEVLLTLVEAYEAKHYPIDLPDPVEAIKFRMDQSGMTTKDLESMHWSAESSLRGLKQKAPIDAEYDLEAEPEAWNPC